MMAAMEGAIPNQSQPQPQPQQPPMAAAERLNAAVQQQLHLDYVKIRAMSLFKAISRILEDFDAYARTNATPKWSLSLFPFLLFLGQLVLGHPRRFRIWTSNLIAVIFDRLALET